MSRVVPRTAKHDSRRCREGTGERHTLVAHESDEPVRVRFNVTGRLIWRGENDEPIEYFDVHDYIASPGDKLSLGRA